MLKLSTVTLFAVSFIVPDVSNAGHPELFFCLDYFQDAASWHPMSERSDTAQACPGDVLHRLRPVSSHQAEGSQTVHGGCPARL